MKNQTPRTLWKQAILVLGLLSFAPLAGATAPERVEICHVPPGNPAAAQTITVSEQAVAAHLAHGDSSFACGDFCPADSSDCDDGNACTDDLCDGVECLNAPLAPGACDDRDALTADGCEPAIGCVNYCLPLPNQQPCGFAGGMFTLWDEYTGECIDIGTVQISVKFETDYSGSGYDEAAVEQKLDDATPALIDELQKIFAKFTPSLTLECGAIAALQPDVRLSFQGELISFDLIFAIQQSALPAGATEATVVGKFQTEYAANNALFDDMAQRLTDILATGDTFEYITVNVY